MQVINHIRQVELRNHIAEDPNVINRPLRIKFLLNEITENDFVPAFMIIESPDENPKTMLFAPDRDFNEIEDGVKIIKEHFNL